ncbi:hypothetical protein M3Y97_01078300 [Aphelenchoides bicaudatus]|nr:hypothetical protein M3Y97_01078300 [Aphelenchoides bicaudatus]
MSKKPKLQNYALLCFIYHQNTNHVNAIIHRTQRFHGLLICRRYLKEFFGKRSDQAVYILIEDTWVSLVCDVKECQIEYMPVSERVIIVLLRLAEFECIHLNLWVRSLTPEFVKGWLEICRTLEEKKSLKSIEVSLYMARESCNRFMFECIPDKITKLYTNQDIWTILGKRQSEMEFVCCIAQQKNLNYSRLFQMNAKHVEIGYDYEGGGLWELGYSEPFLPNPSLRELKTVFRLGNVVVNNSENTQTVWDFHEKLVPAYRSALNCLHQINPKIQLELYEWNDYERFETADAAIEKMHELVRNAKLFIDIAKEIGITSLLIKIKQKIDLIDPKQLNERFVKEFQMQLEKSEFVSYIDYKGARIKLIQPEMLFDDFVEFVVE